MTELLRAVNNQGASWTKQALVMLCFISRWSCLKSTEQGREGHVEQHIYQAIPTRGVGDIPVTHSFGEPSHTVCTLWFLSGKLMGIIELHVLVTKWLIRTQRFTYTYFHVNEALMLYAWSRTQSSGNSSLQRSFQCSHFLCCNRHWFIWNQHKICTSSINPKEVLRLSWVSSSGNKSQKQ